VKCLQWMWDVSNLCVKIFALDLAGLEYEPPMWEVSVLLLDLKNGWLYAPCAPTLYAKQVDGATSVSPGSEVAFTVLLRWCWDDQEEALRIGGIGVPG
jgi:hypothetical protein